MKAVIFLKKEKNLARLALSLVFMALLRTLAECLRLGIWTNDPASLHELEPFLYGSLAAAVACLTMSLLAFYGKYRAVTILAVLAITGLVGIKLYYRI
jgi:hypothetical protein